MTIRPDSVSPERPVEPLSGIDGLSKPDLGRPTVEMLLTLPKFITGEIVMYGAPVPFEVDPPARVDLDGEGERR